MAEYSGRVGGKRKITAHEEGNFACSVEEPGMGERKARLHTHPPTHFAHFPTHSPTIRPPHMVSSLLPTHQTPISPPLPTYSSCLSNPHFLLSSTHSQVLSPADNPPRCASSHRAKLDQKGVRSYNETGEVY